MSLLVFAIAALPAAAVIYVADRTRNKAAIVFAAVVASAVGVLTGNPTYMGVDLVFVGVALYISWNIAKTPLERTPEEIERRRLALIKAQEDQAKWDKAVREFIKTALLVGAMALFAAYKFWTPAAPATAQPPPAIPPPTPTVAQQPPAPPPQIAKKPAPTARKPRTAEQCLKIADERAMVRCLERAP